MYLLILRTQIKILVFKTKDFHPLQKRCNLLIISQIVVGPPQQHAQYCVNYDHEQVDQSAPGKNLR